MVAEAEMTRAASTAESPVTSLETADRGESLEADPMSKNLQLIWQKSRRIQKKRISKKEK